MARRRRRPPPPDDSEDRLRFPFGETSASREGLDSEEFASEDLDPEDLDPEDLDPEDLDPEDLDPEVLASDDSLFGGDSSDLALGPERLPATPPGSAPEDEVSFESLSGVEGTLLGGSEGAGDALPADGIPLAESSESLVDLDSSDVQALISISERIGPASPSGPMVIVDDEDDESVDDSARFQASIVDDSARLAGSRSARGEPAAGSRRRARRRRSKASWRAEPIEAASDEEVPFPERRRRPRRAPSAPPPRPSRLPWALAALAVACGTAGAGWIESRRRRDLEEQAQRAARRLQEAEERAARERAELAARHAKALQELRAELARRSAAAERAREEEAARLAAARAAARAEALGELERVREEAREEAAREATEAAEARLTAAREAAAREERAAREEAVAEAVAAARAEAARAREEALREAAAAHAEELRRLREELEALRRREAEAERGESAAKEVPQQAPAAASGEEETGGEDGAGGEGGEDDWDAFFEEDASEGGDGATAEEGTEGEALGWAESVWGWLRENVHGKVGYKNLSHFSTGPFHDLRKTRHELRLELEYRDWLLRSDDGAYGLKLVLGADVRVDDDDYAVGVLRSLDDEERRRPILTTGENTLTLALDWFELRGGWQIVSWGTGDLFNPTNNLNPVDFSDLFDPRRIPVLALTAAADFELFSLEVHSIPSFTRSRVVLKGKRFDELRTSPVPILRPDDPEANVENVQWAARASTSVAGWDFSVSGFHGFNDFPQPRFVLLDPTNPASLAVDPVFERIDVLGADFATTLGIFGAEGRLGEVLGGIQVHGEIAHFWNESEFADDYAQYVVGFNYQFVDLIGEHDVTVVLEYAGEFVTAATDNVLDEVQVDRALRSAFLGRIVYAVDEDLSFELNAALVTHGPENALIHPGVTYSVTDNVEAQLSGDIFLGPKDTFFGRYRKDGRVIIEVRLLF